MIYYHELKPETIEYNERFHCSVLDAVVLYMMSQSDSIWTAYVGYLVFRALYQMMITVARYTYRNIRTYSHQVNPVLRAYLGEEKYFFQ